MNPLIVLFVLSLINSMKCKPKLCTNGSQVLETFTLITQLVNDSYLITDYISPNEHFFSVVNDTTFPKFTRDLNKLQIDGTNQTMESHLFSFDILSVIDIDSHCVNIPEKLFAINFVVTTKEVPQTNKYTYFADNVWHSVKKMTTEDTGPEALNKINSNFQIIFGRKIRLILYFQSIGLLAISDEKVSALAYCSPSGWIFQKNPIVWIKQEIGFSYLDAGFVDNDKNVIYLFESSSIGGDKKHKRESFHECSYDFKRKLNETKVSITINCQKKPMNSFCSTDEKPNWLKIGSLIGLIAVSVLIAIVVIAIVCLIPSFKGSTIGSPGKDNKTLTSDGTSQQIKPKESLTTTRHGQARARQAV